MVKNDSIVTLQSIFKIGRVLSVNGREVKIKVDKQKNLSHIIYNGELIKNVSVGGYVKILNGFTTLIAKVESEYIQHDNNIINSKEYYSPEDQIYRVLSVSLLGYMTREKFVKGIKQLPLIDNDCYLLSNEDFAHIHCFVNNKSDKTIHIGTLASDEYTPISLGVQKLFSSHVGIFGNTGSGKSYTLAKIYRQLFMAYNNNENFSKNSCFLFIDFNGEYSGEKVVTENKTIYNLSTRKPIDRIPFPTSVMLDLDTLCIFANATEKTQRPFIKRCIESFKYFTNVTHFKNTLRLLIKEILSLSDKWKGELLLDYLNNILPNGRINNLHSDIEYFNKSDFYYLKSQDVGNGSFQSHPELMETTQYYLDVDNYNYPEQFVAHFIHIMYYRLIRDVLDNRAMNEHIAPAINKLNSMIGDISKLIEFKDGVDFWCEKNIVCVNLNDVNQDSKKMIPLLLCHHLYDIHKESKEKDLSYLNIIIDEAHNILSYQSNRESETWKDYRLEVFEEIIKEGRKFGVFLTIASQRPSDISSTIVSQLHNYFIHRLVNDEDIDKVGKTISFLDRVSQESLPILSTGVCVIAGQMVEMPIVVQIDKIEEEYKPFNETIDVVSKWS